ncbi:hypothetical protein ACJX0J_037571, partial [Zea mays]
MHHQQEAAFERRLSASSEKFCEDKNNPNLDRAMMGRLRKWADDMVLKEKIGDVRIQLEMARYLLHHLELAQDIRVLSPAEKKKIISAFIDGEGCLLTAHEDKIMKKLGFGQIWISLYADDVVMFLRPVAFDINLLGDGSNTLVWKDRCPGALFQGAVDMTDRKFLRLACLFNIWGNQHNSMRWIRIADHLNLMQSNKKIKAPD